MPNEIHPTAIVTDAKLGEAVRIMEYCVVRPGSVIGDGCVLYPHVTIESGVQLGKHVEIFHGAVLGKEPKGAGATARQPQFERRIIVGDETSIGPHCVLFYDCEIGSNTLLGDGASIREKCRVGSKCLISRYVTVNYNTTIGDGTKVMDMSHITGNCTVGNNVFISALVVTTNDNSPGKGTYSDESNTGPIFEDGCVVGGAASILPGVRIGAGATVASGAVVTKDVRPGATVFGCPARERAT